MLRSKYSSWTSIQWSYAQWTVAMWIIGRRRLTAGRGYDARADHHDSAKRRRKAADLSRDRRPTGGHHLAPRQPREAPGDLADAGEGGPLLRLAPARGAARQLLQAAP